MPIAYKLSIPYGDGQTHKHKIQFWLNESFGPLPVIDNSGIEDYTTSTPPTTMNEYITYLFSTIVFPRNWTSFTLGDAELQEYSVATDGKKTKTSAPRIVVTQRISGLQIFAGLYHPGSCVTYQLVFSDSSKGKLIYFGNDKVAGLPYTSPVADTDKDIILNCLSSMKVCSAPKSTVDGSGLQPIISVGPVRHNTFNNHWERNGFL